MIKLNESYSKYTNQCQKQIQEFTKDYRQVDLDKECFVETTDENLSIVLFFVLGRKQLFQKQQYSSEFQKLDLQTKQKIQFMMDNQLGFKNQNLTIIQRFKIYSYSIEANYELFKKTKSFCDFALSSQFFDQLYPEVDFYINKDLIIERNSNFCKLKTFQSDQNIVIGIFQRYFEQVQQQELNKGQNDKQNQQPKDQSQNLIQGFQLKKLQVNSNNRLKHVQTRYTLKDILILAAIYIILIYFIRKS